MFEGIFMFGTQKIKSMEVYKYMKKHIQQAVKEIISQYDRIDPDFYNKKKGRNYYEIKICERKNDINPKPKCDDDRS